MGGSEDEAGVEGSVDAAGESPGNHETAFEGRSGVHVQGETRPLKVGR